MKCPKCGYENQDEALYCGMCYDVFKKISSSVKQDTEQLKDPDPNLPTSLPQVAPTVDEKGFFRKSWEVIVHPTKFFNELPREGGYGEPTKFYLISLIFPIALYLILFLLSGLPLSTSFLYLIFLFIGSVALMYVTSGVTHLIIKIFGSENGLEQTFRLNAYVNGAATIWLTMPIGFYWANVISNLSTVCGGNLSNANMEAVIISFLGSLAIAIVVAVVILIFYLYLLFWVVVKGLKKLHSLTAFRAVGVVICGLLASVLSAWIFFDCLGVVKK